MSSILNSSQAVEWLGQFDSPDYPAARLLLKSLELVSLGDFEAGIIQEMEDLCSRTKGRIAVFAVDPSYSLTAKSQRRAEAHVRRLRQREQTDKVVAQLKVAEQELIAICTRESSASRINHVLAMLKRRFPRRLSLNPSLKSMKAERCRHVVLVDDLIGSGESISKFWKAWISRTMKSWLSYGYCKLWIVAYAVHEKGLRITKKHIPYVKDERIVAKRRLEDSHLPWSPYVLGICDSYANRTAKPHAARGYSRVMCPIVFQYGCPNDCPVILWGSSRTWNALFPNRSILPEFFPYFSATERSERHAETLWGSGQPALALALLDAFANNRQTPVTSDLLTILGLLQKGVKTQNLQTILLMESTKIDELLAVGKDLGLVTTEEKTTDFARELVSRAKLKFSPFFKKNVILAPNDVAYYPTQLRSVQ